MREFSNQQDDVAELKTIIEHLKSENDMLRDIIALIPGNVYWKNKQNKYLGCNNNVAQIFGFRSPKEIIGKSNIDLFDAQLTALTNQVDEKVIHSGKEQYIEEHGLNPELKPAIYLTKKLPLIDADGEICGLLGVSFDITERKKMEEELKIAKEAAEASSQAKSQFLAVMNHELRTPLASMLGLVNFLNRGNLPPQEEKNIIKTIESCTTHLLSLVDDVLDFTRLEEDRYHLRLSEVDLHAIQHDIYNILLPLAENKGLFFHLDAYAYEGKIKTDARLLRQILINLASNAIKFTNKGSVLIKTNLITETAKRIELEITVSDSGVGITKDNLELIFEPFKQLEGPYTRQSSRSGIGLGLTIVKKLATLINGHIEVTSNPGEGSAFSLIASFQKANPVAKSTHINSVSHHREIKKKPLVLLIEDDPVVQYIHQKMLCEIGCEVDAVSSGGEALKKLKNHDIVFVDISLPDISGFEVIKAIRRNLQKKKLPIIALTVYNGKEEKLASLKAGADQFKTKPISHTTLKKIMLNYF